MSFNLLFGIQARIKEDMTIYELIEKELINMFQKETMSEMKSEKIYLRSKRKSMRIQ